MLRRRRRRPVRFIVPRHTGAYPLGYSNMKRGRHLDRQLIRHPDDAEKALRGGCGSTSSRPEPNVAPREWRANHTGTAPGRYHGGLRQQSARRTEREGGGDHVRASPSASSEEEVRSLNEDLSKSASPSAPRISKHRRHSSRRTKLVLRESREMFSRLVRWAPWHGARWPRRRFLRVNDKHLRDRWAVTPAKNAERNFQEITHPRRPGRGPRAGRRMLAGEYETYSYGEALHQEGVYSQVLA
jgi:hypothetical protein